MLRITAGWCLLALCCTSLTGCVGLTGPVIMGADAAVVYVTKPGDKPPADVKDQIVAHESWCYRTLGGPQCFSRPQDVPPDRLINVDPPSAYPLDIASYKEALAGPPPPPPQPMPQPAALAVPVMADGPPLAVVMDPAPEHVSPANRLRPIAPPPDYVSSPEDLPQAVAPAAD